MTAVFVHGVDETARLWDDLRARLFTDSIAVDLPGYGLGEAVDDHVDWLVRELRGLGEPVHLVGHGWGALLVVRAVTAHPATARSWVADRVGALASSVHTHWGAALSRPTRVPGLVLQPSLDPFDDLESSDYLAARLAARTQRLDGLGHRWMVEEPGTAQVLERFWNSVV